MRSEKRIKVITLALGLCVATRVALAMCQYAVSMANEGTTSDCSSSCVAHVYFPAVMLCTNTCDTLTCNPGDWVVTTDYWAVGTCSGNKCVGIVTGVNPGSFVQEYNSDDGCVTPCGG